MAKENLKGIKLEIGLETNQFKAGLNEVKRQVDLAKDNVELFKKALEKEPENANYLKLFKNALEELKETAKEASSVYNNAFDEMMKSGYSASDERLKALTKEMSIQNGYIEKSIGNYEKFGDKVSIAQGDLSSIAPVLKEVSDSINSSDVKLIGFNGTIETTKSKVNALVENSKNAVKSFEANSESVETYKNSLNVLNTTYEELEDIYASLINEMKSQTPNSSEWQELNEEAIRVSKALDDVQASTDKVQDEFSETNTTLDMSNNTFVKATAVASVLGDELDDVGNKANDTNNDVIDLNNSLDETGTISFDVGNLIKANLLSDAIKWGFKELVSLANGLKDSFVDVMKTGVKYNATMETFGVSIKAMLNGDEQAAQGVIDAMKEINSQSSFSNEALLGAAQQLIASDIAAEDATEAVEGLAKALAYAGKGDDELKRMAQNLNQIQNAGKASAADLKQFAYAGIPIYKLLAEYNQARFGNGVDSKEDPATYNDIAAAIAKAAEEGGKFYEAFDIQSETYNGQINKIKSSWLELSGLIASDVTSALTESFLPAANEALVAARAGFEENGWVGLFESIIGEIDEFKDILVEFYPEMEPLINGVAGFIKNNKEPIETLLSNTKEFAESTEFQSLVISIGDILTDLIGIASAVSTFLEKYKIIEEALNIILIPLKAIHYFLLGIKTLIDELNEVGFSGKSKLNFEILPSFGTGGGSLGFGALNSGGFASGGITLNASFNVSGSTSFDRATAIQFAEMLTDEINEGLGGLYR